MTSVKRFRVLEEPTRTALGRGRFVFTDAYSVFDWGQMPDVIPGKGQSLCSMGALTFELLEEAGIPTHYRGVDGVAGIDSLEACNNPPDEMAIELTRVPELPYEDGSYDYDAFYRKIDSHYLIPLEIVFRNEVPIGSSLRKRTEPADHGLSFAEWPEERVELAAPIVEFSTKFEESDRYLEDGEADTIAGEADIEELREVATAVNEVVTERADEVGLSHLDGKIECLFDDGTIKVADVTGTLDENRFAYDGRQVSKEVLRQYYARTNPDWVDAVSTAKEEARARNVADWRQLCDAEPNPLPNDVLELARNLYGAGANAYLGRAWFDAPPLHVVMDDVAALAE